MRGKPPSCPSYPRPSRNIPAYAGKTPKAASSISMNSEHPRVCGENYLTDADTMRPDGTSPRMRGKQRFPFEFKNIERNIPAYAGKTLSPELAPINAAEHPRVCGENHRTSFRYHASGGTSPRMRGKHGVVFGFGRHQRNIPAYAGKTHGWCPMFLPPSEHPRVCGENLSNTRQNSALVGTSPRMRGKPRFDTCVKSCIRNIPAYAGKTASACCKSSHPQEHPRVCGENVRMPASAPSAPGTSPRMRGKPGR